MTHPAERHLAQAEARLAVAREMLPKKLAALKVLAPDGYGSGRHFDDPRGAAAITVELEDGSTDSVPASGTEIAVLAAEFVRDLELHLTAFATEADGALAGLVRMLRGVPDVAPVDKADRCSGGEGEWEDPLCTNAPVRNVRSENRGSPSLPVCWACLKRRQRLTGTLIAGDDAQPGA